MRGPDWGLDVAARLADYAEKGHTESTEITEITENFSEHELSIRQHAEHADKY